MGLYTRAHIYTNTPPQSELLAQRCSRLDKKSTNRVQRANTPPRAQPQLDTGYVETGAKPREGRGEQSLGEDVSKLGDSRDMEYPNIASSADAGRVGGEIHGADVVAVDERALGERVVELHQELS